MSKPEAHHDLPRAFRERFEAEGLDVDDPAFGRWVEGGPVGGHQKWSAEFNAEWRAFLRTNPNRGQILEFMERVRNDPRFQ
jgi:hypothetical protein